MALTVEILQLPVLTSWLSGEYPANELLSTLNTTVAPSVLSLPQLPTLNWTLSLTKLLLHYTSLHFTELNWTGQLDSLQDNSSAGATQKTQPLYCRRSLFTAPLNSNGRCSDHIENSVLLLLHVRMLRALSSNGRSLQSHCLAMGLYATIFTQQ
jgi:hypothetical protein